MGRRENQQGAELRSILAEMRALRADVRALCAAIVRLAQDRPSTRLDTTLEQVLGLPTPEQRAQESVVAQLRRLRRDVQRPKMDAPEELVRKCEGCGVRFLPTRDDQRYHDGACRARAGRERRKRQSETADAAALRRRHA